jgi:enoyl-CoA hydratase
MGGEAVQTSNGADPIVLVQRRAAAIIEFRRPERRNALSQAMQTALAGWYPRLAKDPGVYAVLQRSALEGVFSVGGDVREILSLADRDLGAARAALGSELGLCWAHECFSKPTVSLIDGAVMGTGVGISLFGTHRVAGPSYRFRMPETAIGYFPDCGVAHPFARMPHGIGLYLGLTGAEVGPADAYALGLLTHCIPRDEFAAIEAHLADADPVDPVLDTRHRDPGEGPLMAASERIARYFDALSLKDILVRLEKPRAEDQAWAAEVLSLLRSRAPLALCLTFRAIRNAERLDIRETLIQDFRLAWRLAADPDFREGATAVLIDKGRQPRWRHARVEDVPESLVAEHFTSLGPDELSLPARDDMQAGRTRGA